MTSTALPTPRTITRPEHRIRAWLGLFRRNTVATASPLTRPRHLKTSTHHDRTGEVLTQLEDHIAARFHLAARGGRPQ